MAIARRVEPESEPPRSDSLADLFRRLADSSSELIRQEVSLAKLELRESAAALARSAVRLGVGLGLALAGGLALTACAVVLLGDLIGNYWVGSLVVGAVLVAAGAVIARRGLAQLEGDRILPDETLETLGEDARWAKDEAREFKREVL